MTKYDYYNREERAICAHLFRLLHEKLDYKSESPLGHFIEVLSKSNLTFKNGNSTLTNLRFDNISIFSEASIIRDAYQNAKPDTYPFMDDLTKIIMKQEKVSDCRLYSELPKPLNNGKQTHPKQIRQKATSEGIQLNESESRVYGAMQGMFNAKPDLVITIDNILLVCEAKHTESFDKEQLKRTWNIAEVWATLLYKDIGFSEPPIYTLFKLGGATFKPDINWTSISQIADKTYNENDRTRIAIKAGAELLKRQRLE
ncbi:hypothetical protein KKC13_04810 [bacterium]|nr:hypothetical protein [bacterium]